MTGYVVTGSGETLELPVAKAWEMKYSMGLPCDSFTVTIPWNRDLPCGLEQWSEFRGEYLGAVVFTGVIDEVEAVYDSTGAVIEVAGRGMAARLLDNQVLGVEYMTATLDGVISNYVTPFGVTVGARETLPSRWNYVVDSGSSAWAVVDDFARYYSDVVPRFNRLGQLLLTALPWEETYALTDGVAVSRVSYVWKRYGACSEVWVRDRVTREVNQVKDGTQIALGLCRRAVVTTSSQSSNQNRNYDGQYRLTESQTEMLKLSVTLTGYADVEPGVLVAVQRSDCPWSGEYRLEEVEVSFGVKGLETTMILGALA